MKRQEYTELESYYKSVEPRIARTPQTTIQNSHDDRFQRFFLKS